MAFERQDNVREYYRRITEVDIGAVARELLGAHVLHESTACSNATARTTAANRTGPSMS
jgi:hypothetical protein